MTKTIAYFQNGLGNFIEFTPALQALASMDPSGKIDICFDSSWNDSRVPSIRMICENWDIIEDIIVYPIQKFTKEYKRWFYSVHGESTNAYHYFVRKNPQLQEIRINWKAGSRSESDLYMEAVRSIGYTGKTPAQFMPVGNTPDLPKGNGLLIGICNGGFGSIKSRKKWPWFNEFSKVLSLYSGGGRIVKLGYGDELSDVEDAESTINLIGKLDIMQVAYVMKQLDLFITVDTGLMHVADALGVPLLAIFGGSLISKNGPVNRNSHTITLGAECQPCQGKSMLFKTCENTKCLYQLTPAMVMSRIRKLFPVIFGGSNG